MAGRASSSVVAESGLGADAPDAGVVVTDHIPTELPGPGFPGRTADESNAAWPSGKQPKRLAAWPQIGAGTENFTLHHCWKTSVLHDFDAGWPDLCVGLFHAEAIKDMPSCKAVCWAESRCAIWQYNDLPQSGDQCWVGAGQKCGTGNGGDFKVLGGQRLMHGDVRVLKQMKGARILNLFNVGDFSGGDEETRVLRCKGWCYSLISCQFWQYGDGGCWVDAPFYSTDKGMLPDRVVQYPLTITGLDNSSNMSAGEMIQHYCPPSVRTTYAPMAPPAPLPLSLGDTVPSVPQRRVNGTSAMPPIWAWGGLLVLLLAGLAVSLAFAGGKKRRRNGRRSKGGYSPESEDETEEDDDGSFSGDGVAKKEQSRPLLGDGDGSQEWLKPPHGREPATSSGLRGAGGGAQGGGVSGSPGDQRSTTDVAMNRGDFHDAYRSGNLRLPPSVVQQAASQMPPGRPPPPPSPYFGGRSTSPMPSPPPMPGYPGAPPMPVYPGMQGGQAWR